MELRHQGSGRVRFGVFEVDLRAGELRKHGLRIRLQQQPFHVLEMLLLRPREVVTRDELRHHLWQADTFVDFDHGLNSAINRLREALGDSAENPRFIETLPKRGYRFIAPIEVPPVTMPIAAQAPGVAAPGQQEPAVAEIAEPTPPARRQLSLPSRVILLLATGALAVAVVLATLYLRVGRPSAARSPRTTLAVLP